MKGLNRNGFDAFRVTNRTYWVYCTSMSCFICIAPVQWWARSLLWQPTLWDLGGDGGISVHVLPKVGESKLASLWRIHGGHRCNMLHNRTNLLKSSILIFSWHLSPYLYIHTLKGITSLFGTPTPCINVTRKASTIDSDNFSVLESCHWKAGFV